MNIGGRSDDLLIRAVTPAVKTAALNVITLIISSSDSPGVGWEKGVKGGQSVPFVPQSPHPRAREQTVSPFVEGCENEGRTTVKSPPSPIKIFRDCVICDLAIAS